MIDQSSVIGTIYCYTNFKLHFITHFLALSSFLIIEIIITVPLINPLKVELFAFYFILMCVWYNKISK